MRVPFKAALYALLTAIALVPRRVLSSVDTCWISLKIRCNVSIQSLLTSDPTHALQSRNSEKKFKLLKQVTVLLTFSPLWAHLKAPERKKDWTEQGARGKVLEKARGSIGLPLLSSKNVMYRNRGGATATINHLYLLCKKQYAETPKGALFSCPFHTRVSATHLFAVNLQIPKEQMQ